LKKGKCQHAPDVDSNAHSLTLPTRPAHYACWATTGTYNGEHATHHPEIQFYARLYSWPHNSAAASMFKYLGWWMFADDNDAVAVAHNLWKASNEDSYAAS